MESPENLVNEAVKEAKISDYIVSITNKLIKDKKIILSILIHLKKSVSFSVNAFLINEKINGKMHNVFSDEYLSLNYLFDTYSNKLGIDNNLKESFAKIYDSIKAYDMRGIILEKNNNYTFISEDYKLISMTFDDVKRFIKKADDFSRKIGAEIK
jgi:hypothetical protein